MSIEERDPQVSALWDAAEHPEPPSRLDRQILESARQAVARPRPEHRAWWRLAVPFSATAVLVLAVTLLLRVEREAPDRLHDAAPPAMRSLPKQEMAEAETRALEPAVVPAPEQARPRQKRAETLSAERASEAGRRLAPTTQSAAEPVPFPSPTTREADQAAGLADSRAVPPNAAAPMHQEAMPRVDGMDLGKARLEDVAGLDPEQAIERIRRLLREGRREEAIAALATLRRQHPGLELPADLKSLP